MPDSPIGEPIPVTPIPPGREVMPGREGGVEVERDRAIPFPPTPDPDVLEYLRRETAGVGGRGGSGGRPPTRVDDLPPGRPSDALAFYVSFRHGGKWGVFILKSGLQSVAYSMCLMGASPSVAYGAARYLLQNHETAHFLVDRAVLTLESTLGLPGDKPVDLWVPYHRTHNPSLLEEAVANAYAYRMARHSDRPYVSTFIKTQPAGYRDVDFGRQNAGTTWGSFQQSESQLLSDYVAGKKNEGAHRAIGLHTLMAYNDLKSGTHGDLFFKDTDGSMRTLPVWYVR